MKKLCGRIYVIVISQTYLLKYNKWMGIDLGN